MAGTAVQLAVGEATIATALVVLGASLLVSWNVERLLAQWAAAAAMSV